MGRGFKDVHATSCFHRLSKSCRSLGGRDSDPRERQAAWHWADRHSWQFVSWRSEDTDFNAEWRRLSGGSQLPLWSPTALRSRWSQISCCECWRTICTESRNKHSQTDRTLSWLVQQPDLKGQHFSWIATCHPWNRVSVNLTSYHCRVNGRVDMCCWQQTYGVLLNLATTSWSHKRTLCHTIATATLLKVPGYDWAIWPRTLQCWYPAGCCGINTPKSKNWQGWETAISL